ncbi:cytochrome P450 [Microvirga arabica]|uniref:Cytochrome P450 n=1 Tax=Microvirga arabica TaxID=1128671 RepID=A0ABV6Y9N3_9HYPH
MTIREAAIRDGLSIASIKDTLAVLADVIVPTLGKGVLMRRPRVVALAERLNLDKRAVRRLQSLRRKYGDGPLLLPIPGRHQAVILSPEHVHWVLQGAPEPFAPSTLEKHAALTHFEPNVSLISHPPERAERRRFNDELLESDRPAHSMADGFRAALDSEAQEMLAAAGSELNWDAFITAWYRIVRRVILGDAARDDHELTAMLAKLRGAGNWAFLHPDRKGIRHRFHERLKEHLSHAESGSLAARIKARPNTDATAPTDQVAHWLFAFDPGGMATFRALALIASQSDAGRRASEEVSAAGETGHRQMPFVRACILESLRLWPTTPAILRETTEDVQWPGGIMRKHTHVLIYAPYFHRDHENLPEAHQFAPDLWLTPAPGGRWPLIPFSEGPGICPAHNLVPTLGSMMIAAILGRRRIELKDGDRLQSDRPLPGALDNYTLRFSLAG